MTASKVLVILPTLGDRLETLLETLESVDAQRRDVALTLVVVAPPDALAARQLAASKGAVVVDDPRKGISAAINCGLNARDGEIYYAWIGDDDVFRPGGLGKLQHILETRPDAVLAFGGCDYIDAEGRIIATSNAGALAPALLAWGPNLIPHPGTMVRLDSLLAIGGFDTSLKYAMDLDAFLKLRAHGNFAYTRDAVSGFRWHPDSLTVANRNASGAEAEAIKRRHLPAALRPLSPLWALPIRYASAFAAKRVNARARLLANRD
ncbi:glycosyltransferase [Luteimonas sp. gir]|uniref:glycosyltransferase n=1 Tax=Luteimonas sp. gir TaxID=3127960 RepID=UPI003075D559